MSLLSESRHTMKLAFPMIIGQLSQMLLGLVDTLMVARLGVTELAALTMANAIFFVPFIFGIGVLTGVTVITSNEHGAGNALSVRASCRHGVYLGLVIGLLIAAGGWVLSNHLTIFGQPEDAAGRSVVFFRLIMISTIPALMGAALKNHADALNRPWPPFWISVSGIALNVFLNWLLIYGNWGFPRLGLEGAAIATLIARCAIAAGLFIWLVRDRGLHEFVPFRWFRKPDFHAVKRLLAIGFPASLNMIWEVGAFSTAGLLVGRFGETSMAAHQIALSCAGTAFMIPLGLSMALTVRMGNANGAGETGRLRPIMISGWLLAALFSVIAVIVFSAGGNHIASWFIDEPAVVSVTASIFVIVGFFQISDSLQVASSGMLRGLHDAKVPALMGFISYWIAGLPLGMLLGFHFGWGVRGIWWGLAAGLTVAALTLGPRLWRKTRPALQGPPAASSPGPAST